MSRCPPLLTTHAGAAPKCHSKASAPRTLPSFSLWQCHFSCPAYPHPALTPAPPKAERTTGPAVSLSRATPCQDACPVPLPTPAQPPCMHPDPDDSHPWRSRARSWRTGVCSALCLPPGTRSEKAGLSRHPQVGVEEEAHGYIKASAGARWTAGSRANQSAYPCGGGAPQPPPRTEEPEAPASGHTAAAELASPARPEGSQLLGAHPSPPSSSASLAASRGMGANFGLYLLLPSSHTDRKSVV